MSEFTPTTVQVLDAAVQTGFYSHAEVSRWYAAEMAAAKAEAWDEGHDAGWTAHYNGDDFSVYRNPYRADQIERANDGI